MTFKKFIQKIHLWLGFITGLVMVINLLPASIFAFNAELKDWWYHDQIFIREFKNDGHSATPQTAVSEPFSAANRVFLSKRMPLSALKEKVQATLKEGESISHTIITNAPDRAYNFAVFKPGAKAGLTYFSESEVDKEVYINPYTGKIQGEINLRHDWIKICETIHRRMLLHYSLGGKWIIAFTTLIIIFSLLTGLILWFPKTKAALKQRFIFKRNVRWRRRNYDIHNVGGFYSYLLIMFLAVTGLLWSFKWWKTGFYSLFGENYKTMAAVEQQFVPHPALNSSLVQPLDRAFENAAGKRKTWLLMTILFPEDEDHENKDKLSFYLKFNTGSAWEETDLYVYRSGYLVKQALHEHKSAGVKWDDSNYAFHTGSIYGLPTKILMCVTTLFCASLPVSGLIIWWGKRKKKKPGKGAGVKK